MPRQDQGQSSAWARALIATLTIFILVGGSAAMWWGRTHPTYQPAYYVVAPYVSQSGCSLRRYAPGDRLPDACDVSTYFVPNGYYGCLWSGRNTHCVRVGADDYVVSRTLFKGLHIWVAYWDIFRSASASSAPRPRVRSGSIPVISTTPRKPLSQTTLSRPRTSPRSLASHPRRG